MSKIDVTPEMMINTAKGIGSKIEEWDTAVKQLYTLYTELDAILDGDTINAFNRRVEEDRPKYNRLSETMREYQSQIIRAAHTYCNADDEAAQVIKA